MRPRLVPALAAAALLSVSGTAVATSLPPVQQLDPNRITTVLQVSGSLWDFTGTTYGPDIPLAHLHASGGYISAEDCSYQLLQPLTWTLDAGHGDLLTGKVVAASGGSYNFNPEVQIAFEVDSGAGRFAGWRGTGTFTAPEDLGCDINLTGELTLNRS